MPASGISSKLSWHQMARSEKNAREWHFIRAELPSNGSVSKLRFSSVLLSVPDSLALHWTQVDLAVIPPGFEDIFMDFSEARTEAAVRDDHRKSSWSNESAAVTRGHERTRSGWRRTAKTSSSWQQSRNPQHSEQDSRRSRTKEPPHARLLKKTRGRGGSISSRELCRTLRHQWPDC